MLALIDGLIQLLPTRLSAGYYILLFLVLTLFPCILHFSKRMHTRIDPAAEPRLLPQLSQALAPQKPRKRRDIKAKNMTATQREHQERITNRRRWSLRIKKLDWLLSDKLKLLPNERTGRRLNFLIMLMKALSIPLVLRWFQEVELQQIGLTYRLAGVENLQAQAMMWRVFFMVTLYVVVFIFGWFFLIRKNREFYLDLLAMHLMISTYFDKLYCHRHGCCLGIPWERGIDNHISNFVAFPVQLFEFAIGMAGVILCGLFMLYAKSYKPGRACSVALLWLAVLRFFIEFLRYRGGIYRPVDAETAGLFGLTMVQTVCIAGAVLAIAWLYLLPLEKKIMARVDAFVAYHARNLAAKTRFAYLLPKPPAQSSRPR